MSVPTLTSTDLGLPPGPPSGESQLQGEFSRMLNDELHVSETPVGDALTSDALAIQVEETVELFDPSMLDEVAEIGVQVEPQPDLLGTAGVVAMADATHHVGVAPSSGGQGSSGEATVPAGDVVDAAGASGAVPQHASAALVVPAETAVTAVAGWSEVASPGARASLERVADAGEIAVLDPTNSAGVQSVEVPTTPFDGITPTGSEFGADLDLNGGVTGSEATQIGTALHSNVDDRSMIEQPDLPSDAATSSATESFDGTEAVDLPPAAMSSESSTHDGSAAGTDVQMADTAATDTAADAADAALVDGQVVDPNSDAADAGEAAVAQPNVGRADAAPSDGSTAPTTPSPALGSTAGTAAPPAAPVAGTPDGADAMVETTLSRIAETIEAMSTQPPPRSISLDLTELHGIRVRISIDGSEVSIDVADTGAGSSGSNQWQRQLEDSLYDRRRAPRTTMPESAGAAVTTPDPSTPQQTDRGLRL